MACYVNGNDLFGVTIIATQSECVQYNCKENVYFPFAPKKKKEKCVFGWSGKVDMSIYDLFKKRERDRESMYIIESLISWYLSVWISGVLCPSFLTIFTYSNIRTYTVEREE